MRAPALAAGGLLLAACVAPPPARRPPLQAEVPGAWTAASTPESAPGEEWWDDFEDGGLSAAVRAALEGNHELQAAAARVEGAVAQARIAGAGRKPSVSAGVNGSRNRQAFVGFPVPGGEENVLSTTSNRVGASLDISWEVDLWGRMRAGTRAAVADLQATEARYRAARLSLAGQTAKAWLASSSAAEQVELARRTVESWDRSFRQLEDRYLRGLRSPLDVRLSASNLENARALLELRRQQQDALIRGLETLLGRYPGRRLEEPARLPALPRGIPGGLPPELISRRPDLVAAERRLAAADQRVAEARRALYPRLTLTGSRGLVSDELSDLVRGDFDVWSLVGNLVGPLFQGGRLRANVDRTRAAGEEALHDYAEAALRAYAEVETALAAEAILARREDPLRESAEQATAARGLAEDRYRAGLEDYVTVLESQRRELAAESELLSVRQRRLENRVDLYLALGGGFQAPGPAGGGPPRASSEEAP